MELSDRLTKTAGQCGRCTLPDCACKYKITIARKVFQNISLEAGQATQSGGIACRTSLSCLQLTLEHEIIHLIIKYKGLDRRTMDQKIYGSHAELFKGLVYAYFGQTETTHSIGRIILSDETNEPLQPQDASIGGPVSYIVDGTLYKGVITRPSKTNAKIILLDGSSSAMHYEFLYVINDDDEDLDALNALSKEITDKLTYYHSLHVGQQVTFLLNGSVQTDIVRKLRPRTYKLDVSRYTLSYTLLLPNVEVKEIPNTPLPNTPLPNKTVFTIGDTVLLTDDTSGLIIKKNPNTALVYNNNRDLMVVPYPLISKVISVNKELLDEFTTKKAYFASLGPGQRVTYFYKEKGRPIVTTGTVVQKKAQTLIVSFGSNLNRKIHYMNLIIDNIIHN